jgi:bifunctional N-acetylglucosamine-1-phosphate-uridyltransferase/glucosamine-1-phosphate-acetyltransferase GlmU-like protein
MKLPIRTVYFADKNGTSATKTTRAGKPLRAMQHCLKHMRRNDYSAVVAEVTDLRDGKLYGVMFRSVDGQVTPIFEHKPKKDEE